MPESSTPSYASADPATPRSARRHRWIGRRRPTKEPRLQTSRLDPASRNSWSACRSRSFCLPLAFNVVTGGSSGVASVYSRSRCQ